jgi:hypothetical protein
MFRNSLESETVLTVSAEAISGSIPLPAGGNVWPIVVVLPPGNAGAAAPDVGKIELGAHRQ